MWEPFGNTTVLPPTQWHPEPQFRGTFSILSSCLITMSLCIWTSLHLNVPEHRKEHLQKYRKAGCMVLGLLAPELVVWNAWEQRKQVKSLNELMRKKGFMPKESTARERISGWFNRTWRNIRAPFSPETEEAQQLEQLVNLTSLGMHNKHMNAWTDVHSWLVVMGGLAFEDKSPEDQQFMPGTRQRVPISLELFEWMVETRPHLIPDISRGYIEDKSKSDWLAKGLTCWQAGYFCIQCTFRLSQQLSIALLELNVFAHAICALLLFLVWWDKPRDISVPATISSKEALQICAGHLNYARDVVDAQGSKYRMDFVPMQDHPPSCECFEIVHPTTMIASGFVRTGLFMFNSNGRHYRFLKFRHTYWKCGISKLSSGPAADHVTNVDIAVKFTGRDIAHLVKAHEYFTQSCATYQHASYSETLGAPRLGYRQSNWSLGDGQLFMMVGFEKLSDHVRTIAGITFASSCYGGLHLIAWTSEFQSHAAQIWWRAASVTILVTGPFCVAVRALAAGFEWVRSRLVLSQDKSEDIMFWTIFCFSVLSVLWYILCRTFVVVECFILLAHIPESALRVPTWAAYIPSFG